MEALSILVHEDLAMNVFLPVVAVLLSGWGPRDVAAAVILAAAVRFGQWVLALGDLFFGLRIAPRPLPPGLTAAAL